MQRDPAVERIVTSWPGNFSADYAKGLGFVADGNFEDSISAFIEDERIAVQ